MSNRQVCYQCRKAEVMCYCAQVQAFASNPEFIILLHPKERRKAINTGRMAFLCLKNAKLFEGIDFSSHAELNRILNDRNRQCYLLFPGSAAVDLPDLLPLSSGEQQQKCFIILDGTWSMARKMFQLSQNLQTLPQISFQPPRASEFSIREQPSAHCYSTIETVHHILDSFGAHPGGEHHRLLAIFRDMVQKQIDYELASGQHGSSETF